MSRSVAVIGAGAAGLTAALRAAEAGAHVVLLNAHPKIGLKILMSGGTRCNVTHRVVEARDFHGGSLHVVARVLRAFSSEQTRAWFESLGVPLVLEETGKYFPASGDAQTVLDALLGAVARAGVEVVPGARVVRLEHGGEGRGAPAAVAEGGAAEAGADATAPERGAGRGADTTVQERRSGKGAGTVAPGSGSTRAAPRGRWRLGIRRMTASADFSPAAHGYGGSEWPLREETPESWLEAEAVILASGGLSFPRTGSDGTGYALAGALGHTIVPPVPGLTPLTAADPLCAQLQGLSADVDLKLSVGGRAVEIAHGSFLFTHFGYSGPAALDLSRSWLRAHGSAEVAVLASFVPGETREGLLRALRREAEAEPRLSVRQWLGRRLPDRLAVALCAEAGAEATAIASQLDRAHRAALIERLCARPLPVTGTLGYEKAEVTAGGVALDEVNPSTLESRKAPGIYLCGEILDVDGRLGGFNFQWAWSSGTVAGRAAALSSQWG